MIVERLRELLGRDVVLLPIPAGAKGPRFSGWQTTTVSSMDDPNYINRFVGGGNVGVLLGKPSAGLCSIDVDDDKDIETFLELNPKLRATLRTKRARGGNIWVRVKGDFPKLTVIKRKDETPWGEWRSDGGQTVIWGMAVDPKKGEKSPIPYKMVLEAHPIEITFAEIFWPSDVDFPAPSCSKTSDPRNVAPHDVGDKEASADDEKPTAEEVQDLLNSISADCSFDTWLRVGMALHSWNPDAGRAMWDAWSQTAPKRYEAAAIHRHWKTFRDKANGVTISSLFKLAIDDGWKPLQSWPELIPFNSPTETPPFPVEVLPEPFRSFALEVSESRQVPVDLPAVLCLGVAAIGGAKRYKVEVGATHVEPLNLFFLSLLEPAERKTSVFDDCLRPVEDYERELCARARPEIARAEERRAGVEERMKELRRRAAREDKPEERARLQTECENLAAELGESPTMPRLRCADVTPEHLARLLHENGGRIAQVDAEGGAFFNLIAGQYAKNGAANFEIHLRSHAGDYVCVDRMTRTGENIREPALTLILTGQPELLRNIPNREALRGRGLLARFIYCLPSSLVGRRPYINRPIDEAVRAAYSRAVRRILETPNPATAERPDAYHPLRIDSDALDVWIGFYNEIENALGSDRDLHHVRDWAGKLPGAAARIAGVLHVMAGNTTAGAMPATTVQGACAIARWAKYHALAAFEIIGGEHDELPRRVLSWIRRHRHARFSLAAVFDSLRRGMSSGARSDDLLPALAALEVRGYIRPRPPRRQVRAGRKPSPEWDTNPALWDTEDHHENKADLSDLSAKRREVKSSSILSPVAGLVRCPPPPINPTIPPLEAAADCPSGLACPLEGGRTDPEGIAEKIARLRSLTRKEIVK